MFNNNATTSPESRPVVFDESATPHVTHVPISTGVNTIADMIGIYRSSCIPLDNSGSSYTTTIITESTGNITDDYFFNDYCAGEPIMQIATPVSLIPEPQGKSTFFGDSVIEVRQSDAMQEVVFGEEFLSFNLRAAYSGEDDRRFRTNVTGFYSHAHWR